MKLYHMVHLSGDMDEWNSTVDS